MTEPTITTGPTGSTVTTTASLAKIAVAGSIVAGLGLFVGGSVEATPTSEGPSAAPVLASADAVAPLPVLEADRRGVDEPCDDGCGASSRGGDPDGAAQDAAGPKFLGGTASGRTFEEVLAECEQLVDPQRSWGRIEMEIEVTGGDGDEPSTISEVDVTTGRTTPCSDSVDEVTPVDAEGVEHHPELAECLAGHIDVERTFGPLLPGETKRMIMVFSDEPEPPPVEGTALPPADPALAGTEPERAPAMLGLPARGSAGDDAISVVECTDYDCPYCRRAQSSVAQLLDEHPQVAFSVLANPLPSHPTATIAARAAVAAGAQGKFWQMHEALFDDPTLRTVEALTAKAAQLGLDAQRFERALLSEDTGRQVATQAAICRNAGAAATPSFFVGGDLVVGAQGYDALAESVRFELSQR